MGVTAEQRREFEQRGWLHLGPVFDAAELDAIRAEYDRVLERPMKLGEAGKKPFEYAPLLHVQSPTLCRFAAHPRLVEVSIDLLGPGVRLYWDQAVSKPAGADSDVPWHQDNGYTPVVPEEYLTYTVALDAASEANGCLWIQPGSHRRGVQPHRPTDMLFFRGYEGDDTGVAVPQPEGHVLCFSSLTMHRTGANRSDGPRRSWVIQHCDADTRHSVSGRAYDDRLLLARDGRVLDEPVRERPLDLSEIMRAASKARAEASDG